MNDTNIGADLEAMNDALPTPAEAAPAPVPVNVGFADLGLDAKLLSTLAKLGYEEPTPIQRAVIPTILAGRDVIGQAATGTGKTAAFALPLIHRIAARGSKRPQPSALVLVPTRELAMQVAEAIHSYGAGHGVRAMPIYGGQSYDQQIRGLRRGVDIVIATPGRALDHIARGTMSLSDVTEVVLDEADEMLAMGFIEDIESILSETAEERQTVLFSATLPPRVASVAKKYLKDPQRISVAPDKTKSGALPKIRQTAYVVPRAQKRLALSRLLDVENPSAAIIFCRTRHEVDELTETLKAHGRDAEALHGGMNQVQRERILRKLRDEKANLIVATDVAARGLDIDHLSHVVNFDVPSDPDAYVHRIGRVGRAGRTGVALTLAEPREHRQLRNIEQVTKQKIEIAKIPTVADIRAQRLDKTGVALREVLQAGDLESVHRVVDALGEDFDLMDIALAAVKLAHQLAGGSADDGEEIEDVQAYQKGGPRQRRGPVPGMPMTRLYLNIGRSSGAMPKDFVGAITGEAGINGKEIGAIDMKPNFSLVEIATDKVERVMRALETTRIKGKRIAARLDHGPTTAH